MDGLKRYVNDDRFRVDGDKNMRLLAFAFTIVFVWTGSYCTRAKAYMLSRKLQRIQVDQGNKIPTKMKIHRNLAHFYLFQCITCPHFLVLPPPSVIPRWLVVVLLQAAAGNQTLLFFS